MFTHAAEILKSVLALLRFARYPLIGFAAELLAFLNMLSLHPFRLLVFSLYILAFCFYEVWELVLPLLKLLVLGIFYILIAFHKSLYVVRGFAGVEPGQRFSVHYFSLLEI